MRELCTFCDGDGFGQMYMGNCPRCEGSGKEPDMTVKTLTADVAIFTDAELDIITDALAIANAHYRALAEVAGTRYGKPDFRADLEQQARDASTLQLRIEAAK